MSEATGGRMATVFGFNEIKINHIIERHAIDDLYVAGINNPVQIVIGGTVEAVTKAEPVFMEEGARRFMVHSGDGAYHTPLMEESRKEFLDFLNTLSLKIPKIPVISNILGAPYENHRIKERIASQMTHTIRWPNVVAYLHQQGIDEIVQMGPAYMLNEWTNQTKRFIYR